MDAARRRRLLLMLFGVVLAVVAAVAAYTVGTTQPPPVVEIPTEEVVVATRLIPARTTLTPEDVELRSVPADAVLPDALRSVDEAIDQTVGLPVVSGQQITPNLFVATTDDPLGIFPPGEEVEDDSPLWRAFSISVPQERAVSGLLQAGDRVDLIVSISLAGITVVEDEFGNVRQVEEGEMVGIVNLETGEVRYSREGMSTKVTLTDLEILNASPDDSLYVVRVDLQQAEQLTELIRDPLAGDPFTIALRSRADTREVDTTEFGQTLEQVIEFFRFRLPFVLDVAELLGFDFEIFIVPAPDAQPETPGPQPQPQPEPTPEPEP